MTENSQRIYGKTPPALWFVDDTERGHDAE